MRFRKLAFRLLVLGGGFFSAACVPVPKMTPDVIGLGDLLTKPPRVDGTSVPPATWLPGLYVADGAKTATPRPEYTIGPLDELVVTVWGRKDMGSQIPVALNGELKASTVREDGTLLLPFIQPFSDRKSVV